MPQREGYTHHMAVLTRVTRSSVATETLKEVVSGERRFVFAHPIEVEVRSSGPTWSYWHYATGINSYGITREAAAVAFGEAIACDWDDLVQTDQPLHPSAERVKQQLLELISRVEPLG